MIERIEKETMHQHSFFLSKIVQKTMTNMIALLNHLTCQSV
ncbi:hypothetical protein [Carnobacterium maltaromaticum]|nr:hypothetical protein [Carnobacterium maltaromaticum]